MSLSKKQLAILRVAQSKLGLSEPEYRAAMVQITGQVSALDMGKADFEALMGFFEYLGFKPLVKSSPDYGARPGMASFAQLELIRQLWAEYTGGKGTPDSLGKWIARSFKVSSLRFLTLGDARKAIVALKSMKDRQAA
ncbi:MAG: regulatory protein GemA [Pseudomonadota bacterium]